MRENRPDITFAELEKTELHPNAIIVLSGGIVKRQRGDETYYSTTSYKDGLGGKTRAIAGSILADLYPDAKVLTLSHVDPAAPTHSSIYREQMEGYGTDSDRFLEDASSYNTYTEIVAAYKNAIQEDWKTSLAVTNDYHLSRAQYMADNISFIAEHHGHELPESIVRQARNLPQITFVSAEEIVSSMPRHKQVVSAWKETRGYAQIVGLEEAGFQMLRNGSYNLSSRAEAILKGIEIKRDISIRS